MPQWAKTSTFAALSGILDAETGTALQSRLIEPIEPDALAIFIT
jgi:hypothetical protein